MWGRFILSLTLVLGSPSLGHAANTACAQNINKYLYYLAKNVPNLEEPLKLAAAGKTAGEQVDYSTALTSAQDAAGGNISAPVCAGSSSSEGAQKLKEALGNLLNCSENIENTCNKLATCETAVQEYKWKMGNNTKAT